MERYNDHGLGFAPTFPAFGSNANPAEESSSSQDTTSRRVLPDITKNYSETMVYDSHGYIYNSMSGGSTIATEEIEFQYPEDGEITSMDQSSARSSLYKSPAKLYNVNKHHHDHPGKLLTTNSSMTASTWLNETTLASTSLLDQDGEDSSWSSAASITTSVLLDDNEENDDDDPRETDTIRTTNYDDATTYMESPIHQAPIDLVESFLDDLAENESVQRLGNFFFSTACRGRYSSDDDDDDDDEEYEDYSLDKTSTRRGRSPSSRRNVPSSLRSADRIFGARPGNGSRTKHPKRKGLKSLLGCGFDG